MKTELVCSKGATTEKNMTLRIGKRLPGSACPVTLLICGMECAGFFDISLFYASKATLQWILSRVCFRGNVLFYEVYL